MHVYLLGLGAIGFVTSQDLVANGDFGMVTLADYSQRAIDRAKKRIGEPDHVVYARIDAGDPAALEAAFQDVDLVINALEPRFNVNIMQACLRSRANYMDLAQGGPRYATGTPDSFEFLGWSQQFKDRGLLGILGMGMDPGVTNVFARYGADRMDEVWHIGVRDGDSGVVPGMEDIFYTLWSPSIAIEECLMPAMVWEDGEHKRLGVFGEAEVFPFPEPLGPQTVYTVDHEEAKTIPLYLPGIREKGLKRCEFKYQLDQEFIDVLLVLGKLGLNNPFPINVKGQMVIPRDVVVALMPDPAEVEGEAVGWGVIGTLVEGRHQGKDQKLFYYVKNSYEACREELGASAVAYQTGRPPAAMAGLFARGELTIEGAPTTGCYPCENFDPEPIVEALRAHGIVMEVADLTDTV
ncbi:MAG: saccharopine dehydrogenase family protein [Thermoleophilia bacterium]